MPDNMMLLRTSWMICEKSKTNLITVRKKFAVSLKAALLNPVNSQVMEVHMEEAASLLAEEAANKYILSE